MICAEGILPLPDTDDDDGSTESWMIPNSDITVSVWETAIRQWGWSVHDRGEFAENGIEGERAAAIESAVRCGMGLVAAHIASAYSNRLIERGEK